MKFSMSRLLLKNGRVSEWWPSTVADLTYLIMKALKKNSDHLLTKPGKPHAAYFTM